MLRLTQAQRDTWTAAEYEAAAGALGAFVADMLRMGGYHAPRFGDADPVGRAMDMAAAQIVRWTAQDAASYGNAALREYDRMAQQLASTPPPDGPIVTRCAWCPPEKREPVPAGARVSHGICPACRALWEEAYPTSESPANHPRQMSALDRFVLDCAA